MRKFLVMFVVLFGLPGAACTQQPDPSTAQQQAQPAQEEAYPQSAPAEQVVATEIAEGKLSKVDTQLQQIWIKTQDGKEMQFSFDKDTQVEGAGGTVEGLAKMSGNDLKVHYRSAAGINSAVKIEVLPSTA